MKIMEQIELFNAENLQALEDNVNYFIRNLGSTVEIKDVNYSPHILRDRSKWSAMVRYDDPYLDKLTDKLKEIRNCINSCNYSGGAKGMIVDDRIGKFVSNYMPLDSIFPAEFDNWKQWKSDQENCDEWWKIILSVVSQKKCKTLFVPTVKVGLFCMCDRLIQLVKHEQPLVYNDKEFFFDGYVLISIRGFDWDEIVNYANEHNADAFKKMMSYYELLGK
jgi:hypothetical protein